jgi:hypothetical protein
MHGLDRGRIVHGPLRLIGWPILGNGDAPKLHLLDRLIPNQTALPISLITEQTFLQDISFV